MKKILGLDLGSSSIGWAYIHENGNSKTIHKLGVRVVPVDSTVRNAFSAGKAITINKDRTKKHSARKTIHRYKLRKKELLAILFKESMLPDEKLLKQITSLELYGLRSKAVSEQISLVELGRILFHLNQKRGYRSSRKGDPKEEGGKKLSDYLQEIKDRKDFLEKENIMIGQYFFRKLQENPWYRIKQNVYPRECYINEFEKIWECQKKYYPEKLTAELKKFIKEEILFYQRPLKSAKWLVGECRFEKHHKVAPISSPIFQVEKIWESVHNISLTNKKKETFEISATQKFALFEHLDNNEKLTNKTLLSELGIKDKSGWYANEQIKKAGIQGNTTKTKLIKAFKNLKIDRPELLQFNLKLDDRVDKSTGEIVGTIIDANFEKEPLYKLWHTLYSIEDPVQTINTLIKNFGLTQEQAEGLSKLDFTQAGFGNKSARAIRKLLPALMQGNDYSKACELVGYWHSDSLTTEDNQQRELKNQLEQYSRNSLRQPVVEKILNQLVNVVNAILNENELGRPDEIRVELARELKQSKDEREKAFKRNNETDRINKQIIEKLSKEYPGLVVTKKVLDKYKLHEQQNGLCLYSGENIPLSQALRGESVDIDHIIPKVKLFDDSFQNKALVWRHENANKGDFTAHDYMNNKGHDSFFQYLERVNRLYDSEKITRSKRDKLLMAEKEIPSDFINRQLNESRYIAKEATKLLKTICRNVYSTTGSVTEFLRHQWGYNEVLKQLNWDKYEAAGMVKGDKIEGWSKRDDHRHHAIDALVVACTKQSHIQRLNTLNSSITRDQLKEEVKNNSQEGWKAKRSLLEQSIYINQPFTTQQVKEAVSHILISRKPGKRIASMGRNVLKNGHLQRTLTPRGQLHNEFVYAKIKKYDNEKTKLNTSFSQAENVANQQERELILQRLKIFENDPQKAFKDLESNPIWLDDNKTKPLTEVTLWKEYFVKKYTLDKEFSANKIESIVDNKIKSLVKKRYEERGVNAFVNLDSDPIWLNEKNKIPIISVRCITDYKDLIPLHFSKNGETFSKQHNKVGSEPVNYVATQNNHHIAIYETPEGKLEETSVSFWEVVERKKLGLPAIITDPKIAWNAILDSGNDDQNFLTNIPREDWKFIHSLQQDEMFIFRMTQEEVHAAIKRKEYNKLSPNLYRVQKISEKDYVFRHHLETRLEKEKSEESINLKIGKSIRIRSLNTLKEKNPIKVKIDQLGHIIIL